MNITKIFRKLWNDESGQSTTEYILILAVVVMIAMKFRDKLNSNVSTIEDSLFSNMQNAVSQTASQQ